MRVEWRSALVMFGALCVIMAGALLMLLLSVVSLDTPGKVKLYVSSKSYIYLIFHASTISTDAVAFRSAQFGAGIGSVFLTSVGCSGTENNLLGCTYSTSTSGCSHSNDAGSRCQCTLAHNCLLYVCDMLLSFPISQYCL